MILQSQISKLSNRLLKEQGGRRIPEDVRDEFYKKEARLKKTWETRLSAQMANLGEFDYAYRAVKRSFRQAKITEAKRSN